MFAYYFGCAKRLYLQLEVDFKFFKPFVYLLEKLRPVVKPDESEFTFYTRK